jgi:putative ABC transport system permease protein
LLAGFAAIALFLAVVGIYGVTAYVVQQRERELAIRMALGATANALVRLILRDGGWVMAAGVAVGLLAAIPATRLLQNRLYGVAAYDPWTLVAAGTFLTLIGVIASWWPARRAARASPATALKAG